MKICKCCGTSLLLEKLFIHDMCDRCWFNATRCNICMVTFGEEYSCRKQCKKCNKKVCFGCFPLLIDSEVMYTPEKICLVCFVKEYEIRCETCDNERVLSKGKHHVIGKGVFCCGCGCIPSIDHYINGCWENTFYGNCEGHFVINDKKGNKNILLF